MPLARIVGGRLYALDADPGMIERTRDALERTGNSALDLICADAHDVPLVMPEKVDLVLLANGFHRVADQTAMARAVSSVLKPRGRFVIMNWLPIPREQTVVLGKPRGPKTGLRMSPEAVEAALDPADFHHDQTVALPPYHYGAVYVWPGPRPVSMKLLDKMFEQGNVNPEMLVDEDSSVPVEQQLAEIRESLQERRAEYWSRHTPDMWEALDLLPDEDDEDGNMDEDDQ